MLTEQLIAQNPHAPLMTAYEEEDLRRIAEALRAVVGNGLIEGDPTPLITREDALKFAVRFTAQLLIEVLGGNCEDESLEERLLRLLLADAKIVALERKYAVKIDQHKTLADRALFQAEMAGEAAF